jgi:hypothetical protein
MKWKYGRRIEASRYTSTSLDSADASGRGRPGAAMGYPTGASVESKRASGSEGMAQQMTPGLPTQRMETTVWPRGGPGSRRPRASDGMAPCMG